MCIAYISVDLLLPMLLLNCVSQHLPLYGKYKNKSMFTDQTSTLNPYIQYSFVLNCVSCHKHDLQLANIWSLSWTPDGPFDLHVGFGLFCRADCRWHSLALISNKLSSKMIQLLGVFAYMWEAPSSFFASVCPYVHVYQCSSCWADFPEIWY